jgi:hypothetical protein
MSAELLPTRRDPLRRLATMALVTALLGLVAIIYSMVKIVRETAAGEEWMMGVGCCLLIGATATSLIHGVLLSYGARIEALEKRAAANANRPAGGAPG